METVIHQTFGNIFFCNTSLFLDGIQINNKFVGNTTIFSSVFDTIVLRQFLSHIIGSQNRLLSALKQAGSTTQLDVSIRNGKDTCISIGCTIDRAIFAARNWHDSVTR